MSRANALEEEALAARALGVLDANWSKNFAESFAFAMRTAR